MKPGIYRFLILIFFVAAFTFIEYLYMAHTCACVRAPATVSAGSFRALGSTLQSKPLLLYGEGRFYCWQPICGPKQRPGVHCDMPGSCPVSYKWTKNKSEADAVIFNTLDGMSGYGGPTMRARPEQWLVMFAMESGVYYPQIYSAKEKHGFNISADYRLDVADVPVTYYVKANYGTLQGAYTPFPQKRNVRFGSTRAQSQT